MSLWYCTADAVRHEILTGEKVKGKDHRQKAEDTTKFLRSWLKENANNPNISEIDKAAAQNVLKDLENALNTKPN